ncbi:MAG: ADP-ribosylation factor-like protein [Promethearchaeota archaeon]
MANQQNNLQDIKIVIAGLDNAGKTSFLIALKRKYNFYERVKKLKPTIKIDYSSFQFINWLISCWDMGGQEKYRELYVKNPIYFTETDYLYFIIDIQDELKFEIAVNYLTELLDIFRDLDYKSEVLVCFNKYDPKYRNNEEFADRAEMIKDLIQIQNKDIVFKFFNTSIYDISSISKAMSYSLSKLLNLNKINSLLENFINKYNSNYAILYTNSGLIISDCYRKAMDGREFEEIISSKINDDLKFFQRLADEDVSIDGRVTYIKDKIEYVKKYEIKIGKGKELFYLGVSAHLDKLKDIKKELNEVQSILEDTFILYKPKN